MSYFNYLKTVTSEKTKKLLQHGWVKLFFLYKIFVNLDIYSFFKISFMRFEHASLHKEMNLSSPGPFDK